MGNPDTFFWILSTVSQSVLALIAFFLVAVIYKIGEYGSGIKEIGRRYIQELFKWLQAHGKLLKATSFATELEAVDWTRYLMESDSGDLVVPAGGQHFTDLPDVKSLEQKVFNPIRDYDARIGDIKVRTRDVGVLALTDAMIAMITLPFVQSLVDAGSSTRLLLFFVTFIVVLGAVIVLKEGVAILLKHW